MKNENGFLQKVGTVVKKTTDGIKESSRKLAKKREEESREARLKKYNPLFPKSYKAKSFNLPNLIVIVDDAIRKGIDVCEGAIGWVSREKDVEVLHLYDEAIEFSGLQFHPVAVCDGVYYVDPHNRQVFVRMDSYFSNTQEEKLAELQHIAFSLGAKRYKVEMVEENAQSARRKASAEVKIKKDTSGASLDEERAAIMKSKSVAEAEFQGNRAPVRPTLVWYKNDRNVLNLIDMCCAGETQSGITNYTIELSSSNSASMSLSTAAKVNTAIGKMGIKLNCNVEQKSKEEHSQKLLFKLEF